MGIFEVVTEVEERLPRQGKRVTIRFVLNLRSDVFGFGYCLYDTLSES